MFVSIKNNKYQIIISTVIGSLFYYFSRNEQLSMVVTIISIVLLRFIKIDKILDSN